MHTVFTLLCFVVVIHWLIFPYPSGLLHWHCGNLTIAPVPAKQPWWIWINTSCEFIMNECITTPKQSTTKPCAYFLGYTVKGWHIIYMMSRQWHLIWYFQLEFQQCSFHTYCSLQNFRFDNAFSIYCYCFMNASMSELCNLPEVKQFAPRCLMAARMSNQFPRNQQAWYLPWYPWYMSQWGRYMSNQLTSWQETRFCCLTLGNDCCSVCGFLCMYAWVMLHSFNYRLHYYSWVSFTNSNCANGGIDM